MLANPFNPGVFNPDQVLLCRESQFQVVNQIVEQIEIGYPHSPVGFVAPPGLGKTAILKYLANDLKRRQWLCGYSEAGSDVGSAIYDLLTDAQQLTPPQGPISRLLSRVQGFNASAGPVSIGLSLQSIEDGSAYGRLCDLFRELSNTAQFNLVGAALFLDEAQVLPDAHLEILLRALNGVADSPIVLFMAALPNLMDKIVAGSTKRSIPYIELSNLTPLDAACAQAALSGPADLAGGAFEMDALQVLLEFARGHPLTLQMLGRSAWNFGALETLDSPDKDVVAIKVHHARQAIEQVRDQLRLNYYRPIWRGCTAAERAVLRSLARASSTMTELDLTRTIQSTVTDAEIVLHDLVGKGIVTINRGNVNFTTPGFHEFVGAS